MRAVWADAAVPAYQWCVCVGFPGACVASLQLSSTTRPEVLRISASSYTAINSVGPGDAIHPGAASSGNCADCVTLAPNRWFCPSRSSTTPAATAPCGSTASRPPASSTEMAAGPRSPHRRKCSWAAWVCRVGRPPSGSTTRQRAGSASAATRGETRSPRSKEVPLREAHRGDLENERRRWALAARPPPRGGGPRRGRPTTTPWDGEAFQRYSTVGVSHARLGPSSAACVRVERPRRRSHRASGTCAGSAVAAARTFAEGAAIAVRGVGGAGRSARLRASFNVRSAVLFCQSLCKITVSQDSQTETVARGCVPKARQRVLLYDFVSGE
jgi:hypothetical protein